MTDNPAKAFLRQYLAISGRVSALQSAISREMQRAQNTGCFLKEIVVQTSTRGDTMAENIVKAVDATRLLQEQVDEANKKLRQILDAINSLKDERQKELLTRRYVTGQSFLKIEQEMHYSETRVFVIHGRALLGINEWLRNAEHTTCDSSHATSTFIIRPP